MGHGYPKVNRYSRQLDAATAAALAGPGVGGRTGTNFRVGAAIYDGPRLITAKSNSYKTHPKLARLTKYPYLHAEQSAILSAGLDNCHGKNLFVSRVRRDNSLALAKPCPVCMELIGMAGFKNVFYTNEFGGVDTL